MNQQSWKICGILTGIGLAAGLFSRSVFFGFALGAAVSVLMYWRLEQYCDNVLQGGFSGKSGTLFRFLQSYAMMAVVLILAAKYPAVLNIFAAAAGLLLVKVSLIVTAMRQRRELGE